MDKFWDFLAVIGKTVIVFIGTYAIVVLLLFGLLMCALLR